jgi:hypothetical protein
LHEIGVVHGHVTRLVIVYPDELRHDAWFRQTLGALEDFGLDVTPRPLSVIASIPALLRIHAVCVCVLVTTPAFGVAQRLAWQREFYRLATSLQLLRVVQMETTQSVVVDAVLCDLERIHGRIRRGNEPGADAVTID